MSAFTSFFKPKPGSFGQNLVVTSAKIGTGGTTVTNSTTTSVVLAKPFEKAFLKGLSINAQTACLSNGGTVTVQVFKRDNVGTPADRTLTATKSIEADVIDTSGKSYEIAITGTIAQRVFQKSDLCRIDVVAASTIDTAPVLDIVAVWAVME